MAKRPGLLLLLLVAGALMTGFAMPAGAVSAGDTLVNVGSPPTTFSQNKQNEPTIAIDANHPSVQVAGSNDNIDMEACNAGTDNTCPFTPGVGVSGVYFSFDSGGTWTQPTYTGWSARDCLGVAGDSDPPCSPHVGPIGTLPNYYDNGLVSDGDPAVAFGPTPDTHGHFAWANGSRLYYANLTSNFPGTRAFRGAEAVAVSHTDDVRAAAAGVNSAWSDPVIVTRQSSTTFSDKEQVWADNASSSPFFGHVYTCSASFRSNSRGQAFAQPLIAATSADGGNTWTQKQVTPASTTAFNPRQGAGRSGCTVRTDSRGVVYVFANQFAVGMPGHGSHIMVKSFDGGHTWTRPQNIGLAVDTCFAVQFDGSSFRCVEDGIAGARDDLSSAPSVDIANGAPTGVDATDEILRTWVDGRDGVTMPHVMVSWSTDGGTHWSTPTAQETTGDRGYYSAIAASPDGTDAYLVYNAFTTPYRDDTTSPRGLIGVVKHADLGGNGDPGAWTTLHRGAMGDPRTSAQNNLVLEFLGDYVYAAATRDYGAGVWNDTRNGADCPAIDQWRAAVQAAATTGTTPPPAPAPQQDCPATFGDSDIYGGSFADPTP